MRGVRKEALHKEKLLRKVQRIQGLEAILQMQEESEDRDVDYIKELRGRILKTKNELKNMRP
jgi:hypothetical protein